MKIRLEILFLFILLTATARIVSAQTAMTWTVDGVQRNALVFVPPATAGGAKRPLIFAFHGHGGNMNFFSRGMHLQDLSPEAVIVYPQGLPTPSPKDPQGLRPGWQAEPNQSADRDLKFFDAMLATLKKDYNVDEAKVYAAGFSNGAVFSYLLWAQRAKNLAAFGICAGRMAPSVHPTEARPLIVIAGENDQVLPFTEQKLTLETSRQIDQATGTGQACGINCMLYPSTSQTPVMAIVHPGGHVCPPWATKAIVDFFHAK